MCMDIKSLWHTQDSCQRLRERVLSGARQRTFRFSFSNSNRTFDWLKRVDLVKTHTISYVHHWPQLRHAVIVQNYKMCCIHLCSIENFVRSIVPIPMPFTVLCVPHHCGRGASVRGSGGWWLCWWGGVPYTRWCKAVAVVICFGNGVGNTHISAKWWVFGFLSDRLPGSI